MKHNTGQIAVGLLVLTGFILVLVSYSVKLGQMAQVRVETSNAADAGALAAGSWLASGQNEAALITQKILDAVAMMQALYLVPFCPGTEQQQYAKALWQSLVEHPDPSRGFCRRLLTPGGKLGAFDFSRCGPAAYFQWLADGVMEAAWNMGRREFLTAAVNNMMIQYNVGEDARGLNSNLAEEIRTQQKALQSSSAGFEIGGLTWNNGRLDKDGKPLEGFLYHAPTYDLKGYPGKPPELLRGVLEVAYFQYEKGAEAPAAGDEFACGFDGWGIKDTEATGPVADLRQVTLPDHPLAVDASGHKQWELIDLAKVIPAFGDPVDPRAIDVGSCAGKVCGVVERTTSDSPGPPLGLGILPVGIVYDHDGKDDTPPIANPVFNFTVTVSHQVWTAGEVRIDLEGGRILVLAEIPDHPKVRSKAVVRVEPAQFEAEILPLKPTAKAYLTDAE